MAVNELSWRKFPRDTMRNEELDYVSYLLGPSLAAAPFLFYTTAFCKADDDGVFNIEDGVIFSRLMRLGTPSDVLKIAEMLEKRHVITRVIDGSSYFLLTDWDPPQRPGAYRQPRTAEERRKVVAERIAKAEAEKKQSSAEKIKAAAEAVFFVPNDDKKAENVVKNNIDDKNDENVVHIERDREIEEREKKDTHTDRQIRQREAAESAEKTESTEIEAADTGERAEVFRGILNPLQTSAEKKDEENSQKNSTETERNTRSEITSLAKEALSNSEPKGVQTQERRGPSPGAMTARKVFSQFFAKNCYGYSEEQDQYRLDELARRVDQLQDNKNPAPIIAGIFCSQLQMLSEKPGYFFKIPISSESMLKPGVYAHIVDGASKVLMTRGNNEQWQQQVEE